MGRSSALACKALFIYLQLSWGEMCVVNSSLSGEELVLHSFSCSSPLQTVFCIWKSTKITECFPSSISGFWSNHFVFCETGISQLSKQAQILWFVRGVFEVPYTLAASRNKSQCNFLVCGGCTSLGSFFSCEAEVYCFFLGWKLLVSEWRINVRDTAVSYISDEIAHSASGART